MKKMPRLTSGGSYTDQRGTIKFFNELDLAPVRRFYILEFSDPSKVRAWNGHKVEQKWLFVIEGSLKIVLVKPDDWQHPSADLPCEEMELQAGANQVLHIPGGFAFGFQSLAQHSRLMMFSDFTIEQSKNDDFRFDQQLWYDWSK